MKYYLAIDLGATSGRHILAHEENGELVLEEIHKSYVKQDKESEFVFYFNMKYVEETMDSITVSVPSAMMQQMMLKKSLIVQIMIVCMYILISFYS